MKNEYISKRANVPRIFRQDYSIFQVIYSKWAHSPSCLANDFAVFNTNALGFTCSISINSKNDYTQ